ncbi:MAG: hypothetical protein ACO3LE_07550 [Bdellovibrionota bacterium]
MSSCQSRWQKTWHRDVSSPSKSIKNCQARIFIRLEDRKNQQNIRSTATMRFKNQGENSELEMTFFSPLGTRAAKLKITPTQAIWMEASRQTPLKKHPLFADLIRDRWWEKFGFIFGILPADPEAKISTNYHSKSRTLQSGKNEVECEYLTPTRVKQCRIEFSDLTGLLELNQYKCEG